MSGHFETVLNSRMNTECLQREIISDKVQFYFKAELFCKGLIGLWQSAGFPAPMHESDLWKAIT
jgi:hypothetical protein